MHHSNLPSRPVDLLSLAVDKTALRCKPSLEIAFGESETFSAKLLLLLGAACIQLRVCVGF